MGRTGGAPSVPLDDAYIHFQFARSFAELTPFVYTEGSLPVAGATSLLWPALLAPAYWLGVSETGIIWWAWLLGFAALGLVARETHALARHLLSPLVSVGVALMVLCFGGLVWLAASGMEAVPFAWLWLRTFRRLVDWYDTERCPVHESGTGRELLLLALATPLMRPEGAIAAMSVALALVVGTKGRSRFWGFVPLLGVALPRLMNWYWTGSTASTTSLVKWLPNNPYLSAREVMGQIAYNLRVLYGTLFNGEAWSASVVPSGGAIIAVLALPLLAVHAYRERRYLAGAAVLVAALGIWIPTTYDTFLWNRLRYLWPFAPAWFIALGAVCDLVGEFGSRFEPRLRELRVLLVGILTGTFAAKLPIAIDDVAESSNAIREQQVSLGRWAREHLPRDAVIGVNDTGAIAYFSERRTFDVVGLTTRGEAKYWLAGAGSRFEHYEKLSQRELPTHFIVYPEWFAIPPLLGTPLTERYVNATILGGTTMAAYQADYTVLDSGAKPTLVEVEGRPMIDQLDVADLESEREHGYELLDARQANNRVFSHGGWADGGRAERTRERFRLRVEPGGLIVLRASTSSQESVTLSHAERRLGSFEFSSDWDERSITVPHRLPAGTIDITLECMAPGIATLHYFSYGSRPAEGDGGA